MRVLPLPSPVDALLLDVNAPARLRAHLTLVHDVAATLTDWLRSTHPAVEFDRAAVLFGAATHDIGKVVHPSELSAPGSEHEPAGERLLLAAGVEPRLARFAATHGSWHAPGITTDDILVSVADKVWKAKRVADLEQLLVGRVAEASAVPPWQAFLGLDDELTRIADSADARLAYQNSHSVA
ncbi:HD domain-containing protein [Actinoplanes sp. TBRC 11911]|uniref:HD domain-containing protein n=1 Tax=Actinoplanes sp. TBRC 11911 TaxID=2729386 RepID=UPI0020071C66|nr:HD domain-containing protein [Actinoplanes sp. TBRC 11911]